MLIINYYKLYTYLNYTLYKFLQVLWLCLSALPAQMVQVGLVALFSVDNFDKEVVLILLLNFIYSQSGLMTQGDFVPLLYVYSLKK